MHSDGFDEQDVAILQELLVETDDANTVRAAMEPLDSHDNEKLDDMMATVMGMAAVSDSDSIWSHDDDVAEVVDSSDDTDSALAAMSVSGVVDDVERCRILAARARRIRLRKKNEKRHLHRQVALLSERISYLQRQKTNQDAYPQTIDGFQMEQIALERAREINRALKGRIQRNSVQADHLVWMLRRNQSPLRANR